MIIIVIISCILLLCCMLSFIKTENDYANHKKVMGAIEKYATITGRYEMAIKMLMHIESLDKTTSRFWDWGYKNILPKQYFELIKPYID